MLLVVVVVVTVGKASSFKLRRPPPEVGAPGTVPVEQSGCEEHVGAGEPLKVKVALGCSSSSVEYLDNGHNRR